MIQGKELIIGKKELIVYDDGRIFSKNGKELSQELDTTGRMRVSFVEEYKGKRKHYLVHRLVAMAFLPNPENLPQINHIDGNPTNNNLSNLEWCSPSYNQMHSRYVLKNDTGFADTAVMCVETDEQFISTREAWRKMGINYTHISECANGKRKTAGGYHWRKVKGA